MVESRRGLPRPSTVFGFTIGLLACTATILASCSSNSDGSSSGNGASSSGTFQTDNTPADAGYVACVAKEAEIVVGKRPVDIVFVVDNSPSLADEIADVEDQINENFTSIIDKSDTDYHVIMISSHGAHDAPASPSGDPTKTQKICVRSPLSGASCDPIPLEPSETAKFFHHDVFVSSQDGWCKMLTTFRGPDDRGRHPKGWSEFLRPNAFKLFAIISDDRVKTKCNGFEFDDQNDDPAAGERAAGTFDSVLLAMSPLHFGNAKRRNYVWHSIIALAPFNEDDPTMAHPPDSPIVTKVCDGSVVSAAPGYQALSRLTGGLRYPTCGLDYTTIFRSMALDVINRTSLACDYPMPPSPATGTIDPTTTVVRYTSKSTTTDFQRIDNAAACGPNKFYIEGDRIKLCDDTCGVVQNDTNAQVKLLFGCQGKAAQ